MSRFFNKYKVAETIVDQIKSDLKKRMESGDRWDLGDEKVSEEVTDAWEDIVISVLKTHENRVNGAG